MNDLKHLVGAGGCWCGFYAGSHLTHPEHADLFEGIRRHIGRFDCGHVQGFLLPPVVDWGDWCQRCQDMRWVVGGCDCKRFEDGAGP